MIRYTWSFEMKMIKARFCDLKTGTWVYRKPDAIREMKIVPVRTPNLRSGINNTQDEYGQLGYIKPYSVVYFFREDEHGTRAT
jgi:hypothetical protein